LDLAEIRQAGVTPALPAFSEESAMARPAVSELASRMVLDDVLDDVLYR
jgi:hypothetical protein